MANATGVEPVIFPVTGGCFATKLRVHNLEPATGFEPAMLFRGQFTKLLPSTTRPSRLIFSPSSGSRGRTRTDGHPPMKRPLSPLSYPAVIWCGVRNSNPVLRFGRPPCNHQHLLRMVGKDGFEPPPRGSSNLRSTPELHSRIWLAILGSNQGRTL